MIHDQCFLILLDSLEGMRIDLYGALGWQKRDVVLEDIGSLRLLDLPQVPENERAVPTDAEDAALDLDQLNNAHLL